MPVKRKLVGTALLLALLVCTMGADAVFFNANEPTPNPGGAKGKISAAGTYTTDAGHEQAGITFTADDGIFGVNYTANTDKTLKTWNLPASNLSAGTYDCQASMGVDDGTKLWQMKSAVVKGVKVN